MDDDVIPPGYVSEREAGPTDSITVSERTREAIAGEIARCDLMTFDLEVSCTPVVKGVCKR